MASAWRLTKTKFVGVAWDGEGASKSGGRWNSVGVPVVYASGSLSLALVEILVHLPSGIVPAYSAIPVEFDDSLVSAVERRTLPRNWRQQPPPKTTQAIGDKWVAAARSAVLQVPSVVVPNEFNYVLNPLHADFSRLKIGAAVPFPFDPRLPRDRP